MSKKKHLKSVVCLSLALILACTPFFSTHAVTKAPEKEPAATAQEQQVDQAEPEKQDTEKETKEEAADPTKEIKAEQTKETKAEKDTKAKEETKAEDKEKASDKDKKDAEKQTKSEYIFKSGALVVKAKLSDPDIIPDDAKLKATRITDKTTGYNYDAYMDALNKGEDASYTKDNTLLYDVAFIKDGKEIQPDGGTVTVTFDFKDDQLAKALGVKKASDLNVIHLPLKDKVRDKFDTTKAAKSIKAKDIEKEAVKDKDLKVSVKNETVELKTKDFSAFAFTVDFAHGEYTYSIAGESSILLSELFKELKIDEKIENVKSVEFSDSELIKVTEKDSDWELKSLKAFSSEELLTVTLNSGETIKVTVTDDSVYNVTIQYVNSEGQDIDSVTLPQNKYYYVFLKADISGDKVHAFALPSTSGITPVSEFVNQDNEPFAYTTTTRVSEQGIRKVNESANEKMPSMWKMKDVNDNCRLKAGDTFDGLEIQSIVSDGAGVTITLKELPKYSVNVQFYDKAGNNVKPTIDSNYKIRSYIEKENAPWFYFADISLNDEGTQTYGIADFSHRDNSNRKINYSQTLSVNNSIVSGEERDLDKGLHSGGVIKDSDNGKLYVVNFDKKPNGVDITGREATTYELSLSSDDESIAVEGEGFKGHWYVLSTLTKADGSKYYYVKEVANNSNAISKINKDPIPLYYADSNSISSPSSNYTSAYVQGDSVENVLVFTGSSAANSYNDIIHGFEDAAKTHDVYKNGDVLSKYAVEATSQNGVGSITLRTLPDFKLKTQFVDAGNSLIDASELPDGYKLLIKMTRGTDTYYALQPVDNTENPSGESGPIVFYKYSVNNGNATLDTSTPYYYGNANGTISTQVVTGAPELSADLIQHKVSTAVFYNENTVGGTQSSDLTKNLFSTSSEISDDNLMTTTFKKQKDVGVEHDITVSFFKEHTGDVSTAELNPAANNMDTAKDAYFFRVQLYNNGKLVAYKIVPVEEGMAAEANSGGTFTQTIPSDASFQLVDDKGIDIDGGTLHYDPTVYTSKVRFYKANTAGQLPKDLTEVSAKGKDTFEGYDFWQNVYDETKDGEQITHTETNLALYRSYKKTC